MQIQQILAGLADAALSGTHAPNLQSGEPAQAKAAESAAPPVLSPSRVMADIVAQYDVTHITPVEFSELIHKLAEAGVLAGTDLETLATVRADLEAEGVDADESIDLVEFYADRLERLRRDLQLDRESLALKHQFAEVLKKLNWLQKLALIHSDPTAVGLDAAA